MKQIYLVKMYVRFYDDKDKTEWRRNARPLSAYTTWKKAKERVLILINNHKGCELYKNLYYIEKIDLY